MQPRRRRVLLISDKPHPSFHQHQTGHHLPASPSLYLTLRRMGNLLNMLLLRQYDSTPSWPESIDKNKPLSLRSDLVSAIRPTLGNLHLQSDNLSSWLIGPKFTGPSKTIILFPIRPVSLKCRKVPSARDPQPDPRTTPAMIRLQSSSQMVPRRIASILHPSR